MPRNKTTIPKAPVARIMAETSSKRIGDDAAEVMVEFLTDYAIKLGKYASTLAFHSGRRTVNDKDVYLAAKR